VTVAGSYGLLKYTKLVQSDNSFWYITRLYGCYRYVTNRMFHAKRFNCSSNSRMPLSLVFPTIIFTFVSMRTSVPYWLNYISNSVWVEYLFWIYTLITNVSTVLFCLDVAFIIGIVIIRISLNTQTNGQNLHLGSIYSVRIVNEKSHRCIYHFEPSSDDESQ
jgi:hypothetical protein